MPKDRSRKPIDTRQLNIRALQEKIARMEKGDKDPTTKTKRVKRN